MVNRWTSGIMQTHADALVAFALRLRLHHRLAKYRLAGTFGPLWGTTPDLRGVFVGLVVAGAAWLIAASLGAGSVAPAIGLVIGLLSLLAIEGLERRRMIVGWRVAGHMRTGMVLDALEMARWSRGTYLEGLVAHSDAGSQGQFTSIRYGERLAELGGVPSIGSVGDSYDNARSRPPTRRLESNSPSLHQTQGGSGL
jgi:hypothetical protein